MNQPPKKAARAGGSLIAVSILAGVIGGIMGGQPSAGFLMGLAVGIAGAALLWLWDRRQA